MFGYIIALVVSLSALVGLALVLPSVIFSWRVVPFYYHFARLGLPLITLVYFAPRLFGINFPPREISTDLLFLAGLGLVVIAILLYLYRGSRHGMLLPQSSTSQLEAFPLSKLELRTARPEDLPGAGTIFAEAFSTSFDLDFGPDRARNARMLAGLLEIKMLEVQVAVSCESKQVLGAMWLDLGDTSIPSINFKNSYPILRRNLSPIHALYYAAFAIPGIMSRRGSAEQAYIQWLGVHPDFQGQHIGQYLVEMAVEMACQRTRPELALHTERHNLRARKLYEKMGFANRTPLPLDPRVLYVKPLKSS